MKFTGSSDYTVGAEWELHLLDSRSFDLTPGIGSIMKIYPDDPRVKPEFVQSCVELNSNVCANATELRDDLLGLVSEVDRKCQQYGMLLAAAGTHPTCKRLAIITPLPRYRMIESRNGFSSHAQVTFATHIHVSVESGNEAVDSMAILTPTLPVLIALSANSPFWRGHQTGYACYRQRLLAASPSFGRPPSFTDWSEFSEFFAMANRAGSVQTIKDVHWDIRPHPTYGTVEIRVMDAQTTVAEIARLAALIRTLMVFIRNNSRPVVEHLLLRPISVWADRENYFRAAHWGLESEMIVDRHGATLPIRSIADRMIEALLPTAAAIGERELLEELAAGLGRKAGYRAQLQAFAANNDPWAVIRDLRGRLKSEIDTYAGAKRRNFGRLPHSAGIVPRSSTAQAEPRLTA